ncbi:MAG TPA: HAMP domain-containing sensor histidine kinase, partial [Nitrospiraceae bacterium]|nr:HAMP domain-containing sensor histidine kinase [Nitrospiraceae bacterium]
QHKAELERMDRLKDHFLATIAHEIRNPLSAVTNVADVLKRRAATYPQISEACKILDRQTAHAVRLVDDLMDISRVRSGKIHLRKEPLQIGEVIAVAADSVRPGAVAAGQTLEIAQAESPLIVYGDFARLTQVFSNLLGNAVRYTPRGGSIRVYYRREGAHAVIVVSDTGIGIPKHMLGRIFDMFEQADTAVEHSQSGLGIGLALVRKLLALHDGEVIADSPGINRGSQFTVRLPLGDRAEARRTEKLEIREDLSQQRAQ